MAGIDDINHDYIRNGANRMNEGDAKRVLENEGTLFSKITGPLVSLFDDIKTLFQMIGSYINGEYRDVPWFTIAAATFALLYLINPIDLIPDVIPGVGLIDDAAVITICIAMIREDVNRYRQWRAGR